MLSYASTAIKVIEIFLPFLANRFLTAVRPFGQNSFFAAQLSDKRNYPLFGRLVPSDVEQARVVYDLVK